MDYCGQRIYASYCRKDEFEYRFTIIVATRVWITDSSYCIYRVLKIAFKVLVFRGIRITPPPPEMR